MTNKEKEIVEEMLSLINNIKDKTDDIDTDERIPQLELNVITAKIEKLYELSVVLKYLHEHIDLMIDEKVVQILEKKEKEIEEVKVENVLSVSTETKLPETLIDKPIVSTPAVAQKSVVDKIQNTPIQDIKTAIGINDKFQFIKELFNNNPEEFQDIIQKLNNADNLEHALSFIQNYNWDFENPIVERFINLINRRHLS
jgi:hypothetical protein